MHALRINNVSVSYQGQTALENASVTLPVGSICGLVGMNGAGKSTLFQAVMGFVPLDTGTIEIYNSSLSEAQKSGYIAYMPQAEGIDWQFPIEVYDVVMMGRYGYMNALRQPRKEDHVQVEQALRKVNMWNMRNRQIGQLSGGQKKRIFMARALAQNARLMLLDEPFAGVDAKTEAEITDILTALKQDGKTILISTHELTSLSEYCDHVILIKKSIVAAGPTEKAFTPANIEHTFEGMIHRLAINHRAVDINH